MTSSENNNPSTGSQEVLDTQLHGRIIESLDRSADYDDASLDALHQARVAAISQLGTANRDDRVSSEAWHQRSIWFPRLGFVMASVLVAAIYFLQTDPMDQNNDFQADPPTVALSGPEEVVDYSHLLEEELSQQEMALELLSDELVDMEFYEALAFVEWLESQDHNETTKATQGA